MIKHLATLPNVINEAAKAYDPAKVTKYVIDLATMYHKFYNNCRIMGEDESVMQARLSLSLAVKQVIKNILDMLKITCPESIIKYQTRPWKTLRSGLLLFLGISYVVE